MLRSIIVIQLITVFTTSIAVCQSVDEQLLLLEKRVYHSSSDSVKNQLLYLKQQLYIDSAVIDTDALAATKRIDFRFLPDSSLPQFFWNSSIISFLNADYVDSDYYLDKYILLTNDTSIETKLLLFAVNNEFDQLAAKAQILELIKSDTSFKSLSTCLLMSEVNSSHRMLYLISSALIPGSGTMLQGEIIKGTSSLIINGAVVFALVQMVRHSLYINAFAWGLGLGIKFYSGNVRLTESVYQNKRKEKERLLTIECKKAFDSVLEKYPLKFK